MVLLNAFTESDYIFPLFPAILHTPGELPDKMNPQTTDLPARQWLGCILGWDGGRVKRLPFIREDDHQDITILLDLYIDSLPLRLPAMVHNIDAELLEDQVHLK